MKIYATYNIKGGVGKTSTAVNLAYLAARDGYRVLLWDLDPQGAATFLFRVRPRVKGGGKALIRGTRSLDGAIKGTDFDHLDLLPADFTYRNLDLLLDAARKPARKLGRLLAPLRAEYDVVFLDCPPSISLLSESVLHAADILLVPLIPTTLSVRTLDQLTEFIADFDGQRPDILAFFSMIDRRKSMHKEIAATLPGQRSDVAATAIPALSLIEQMSVRRAPVTAFAPRSAAARSYAELWAEARERSGLRPVKGSVRAPAKTPASAPAKTPAGAAAKTPARAPAKTPARAPAKTPARAPAKTPARAPAKTPVRAPAKTPARAAAKTPAKTPARAAAKTPARAPVSPGRAGSRSSPR
jgi:chromosome partitioning protein